MWGLPGEPGEASAFASGLNQLRLESSLQTSVRSEFRDAQVVDKEFEDFSKRVPTGVCNFG